MHERVSLRRSAVAVLLSIVAAIPAAGRAQEAGGASARTVSATATAASSSGRTIVVSLSRKRLWLIQGRDTLMDVSVAIGMDTTFTFRGRTYTFETPLGTRRVLAKQAAPLWSPPDWHYFELAAQHDLEPVRMKDGLRVGLLDGSVIEMRDSMIVRVDATGKVWNFPPGTEVTFDGKVFIPPPGYPQRRVPEILGPYKLDTGGGYLIHGTNEEDTIGQEVSHGCVRLHNEDITRLYSLVPVGTVVRIVR